MLDIYNLPLEFFTSLEFFCIVLGVFPVLLGYVLSFLVICVEIVTESQWYKKRQIGIAEVQTDPDLDLMHFFYTPPPSTTPYPSTSNQSAACSFSSSPHDTVTSTSRPISLGSSSSVKSTQALTTSGLSTRRPSSGQAIVHSSGNELAVSFKSTSDPSKKANPSLHSYLDEGNLKTDGTSSDTSSKEGQAIALKPKSFITETFSDENSIPGGSGLERNPLRMTMGINIRQFSTRKSRRDKEGGFELVELTEPSKRTYVKSSLWGKERTASASVFQSATPDEATGAIRKRDPQPQVPFPVKSVSPSASSTSEIYLGDI